MLNPDSAVRVKTMRIGELAMKTGVSVRMLRYYESHGLLMPGRSAAGYRIFTADDEQCVRRIRQFNSAGLPLTAIQPLLSCLATGKPPCKALRARLRLQISELDRQMAILKQSRGLLSSLLSQR